MLLRSSNDFSECFFEELAGAGGRVGLVEFGTIKRKRTKNSAARSFFQKGVSTSP